MSLSFFTDSVSSVRILPDSDLQQLRLHPMPGVAYSTKIGVFPDCVLTSIDIQSLDFSEFEKFSSEAIQIGFVPEAPVFWKNKAEKASGRADAVRFTQEFRLRLGAIPTSGFYALTILTVYVNYKGGAQ